MESIKNLIKKIELSFTQKINKLDNKKILTYDRTMTTSLVILNLLNLLKKRK